MLIGECSPNVRSGERRNDAEGSGESSHRGTTVKKEFNSRMDALIEFTDSSRNRISLMESQNKTKKSELEDEYLFLKKIGDVCKLSCDYYLETNVNFHEACENFKILFRAFEESLVNLKSKVDEADSVGEKLSKVEEKVNLQMRESKEAYEASKEELKLLQTDVHYMKNESGKIINKIKEVDYQINQHTEAFESFHILTHLNTERISVLQNDCVKMGEEREEVLRGIQEATAAAGAARDGLVVQRAQLEEEREALLENERELTHRKEKLAIRRSEAKSDDDRLKSQMQFMQNQLSSQEYFLSVIKCGLDGSIRTRKELSAVLGGINREIEDVKELMEATKMDEVEERKKGHEMEEQVKQLATELGGREGQLEELAQEEKTVRARVEGERSNASQSLLNELVKGKKLIDGEIGSYQEEARKLVMREGVLGGLVSGPLGGLLSGLLSAPPDGALPTLPALPGVPLPANGEDAAERENPLDAHSPASEALLKGLQHAIDRVKERITEEQNEVWRREREVQRVAALTSELRSQVLVEADRGTKLDALLEEQRDHFTKLSEREREVEKELSHMEDLTKKEKLNYEEKQKEAKRVQERLAELNRIEEEKLRLLEKEYHSKKQNLLCSSGDGLAMVNSVEKKRLREDVASYVAKTKGEFALKKREFERGERESAANPHKFGYFDVTSPGEIRKSMHIPSRSVKSPHIARLLEKIKLRKECQTLVGTKKVPLNQVSSSDGRRSRTIGGGSSNRPSAGKGAKGAGRSKPFLNTKAPKGNDSFDLFHHL
ncbi:hypothetical protein PVBG_03827 [Plasmodium vivax Brazil I]|uniref:Uncharacterized protein n=1 Tax=Plasmodium vivax (strain Brazil I) TaxID=1033975 RepID=A0A0J9SY50_PLAV1|nr:hypothetical protein PVBG_03827 [Plasmodium vivax Brazil I]